MSNPDSARSLAGLRDIHDLCCEFEVAWDDQRRRLEEFLDRVEPTQRDALLLELLRSELELRMTRGETPRIADYLERFADAAEIVRTAFQDIAAARPDSTPSTRPSPGARFAHYELLEELARGGMGIVYRARDTRLGRVVALKLILHGPLASIDDLARFELEARAVAKLDHPGIVPVYETGEWAGHRYLTMPLIAGQNLAQKIASQSPLSIDETVAIVREIALAVQSAHEAGIIHRDLKPRNILIDESGRARVTDFGLAKIHELLETESFAPSPETSRRHVTVTGQVLGTLHYLSPEQSVGDSRGVTFATDVYAIGVIAYEMLLGQPPFQGLSVVDLLKQIENVEPPSPRSRRIEVPKDLSTIVVKCLDKTPARRYRSMSDLVRDLDHFLAGRPIEARPIGSLERSWRWCRRNPYAAVALFLIGTLIPAIAVESTVAALLFRRQRDDAVAARQEVTHQVELRRQQLFHTNLEELRAKVWKHDFESRDAGLTSVRAALESVSPNALTTVEQNNLISATIPFLTYAKVTERVRIHLSADNSIRRRRNMRCDINPSFDRVAIPTPDGRGTLIRDLRGRQADRVLVDPEREDVTPLSSSEVQFSPSGRWLLVHRIDGLENAPTGSLCIWDVETGRLQFRCDCDHTTLPRFHPDEAHVLIAEHDSTRVVSFLNAKEPPRLGPGSVDARPAYSADASLIALPNAFESLRVLRESNLSAIAEFSRSLCFAAIWHPQRTVLLMGDTSGTLYEWNLSRGQQPTTFDHSHTAAIDCIVCSADGNFVGSSDINDLFVIRDYRERRVVTSGHGRILRLSSNGDEVAVTDGTDLIVYSLQHPRILQVLRTDERFGGQDRIDHPLLWAASYASDSKTLAVSSYLGVQMVDVQRCEWREDLDLDFAGPLAFRPDGSGFTSYGYFSYLRDWPIRDGQRVGPPRLVDTRGRSTSIQLKPQHSGRHAEWSADGKWLVAADYRHNRVMLYDNQLQLVRDFTDLISPIQATISPDSRWLSGLNNDGKLVIWNRETGEIVLTETAYVAAAFSPDSRYLAVKDRLELRVYDVSRWKHVRTLPIATAIAGFRPLPVFHRSGRFLAAADDRGQIQLVNHHRLGETITLDAGQTDNCLWIALSPNGRQLAVVRTQRVELWDLQGLARELAQLNLSCEMLSDFDQHSPPDGARSDWTIDHADLPASDYWHRCWLRLAAFELVQGNYSDATIDLDRGLASLPLTAAQHRAATLTERGRIKWLSGQEQSAQKDWVQAIEFDAGLEAARCGLAQLMLLGSSEYRDRHQAEYLLAPLVSPATASAMASETATVLHAIAVDLAGTENDAATAALEAGFAGSYLSLSSELQVVCGYRLAQRARQCADHEREQTILQQIKGLEDRFRSTWHPGQRADVDRAQHDYEAQLPQ